MACVGTIITVDNLFLFLINSIEIVINLITGMKYAVLY